MCGGVRGVGAGGIVSSAYCLLYKLFTLKLTRKQVNGLLTHCDSPYIRGLGFMYIRYTQPPQDLWTWFEEYLFDDEEVDVKAGGGCVMTIGEMLRQWLMKLEWFSTLFPRIPVPVQKSLDAKLRSLPVAQPEPEPAPEHIPDENVSFGEAERQASMRDGNRSPVDDSRKPRPVHRSPPPSRSPHRRPSPHRRNSPHRRPSPHRHASPARRTGTSRHSSPPRHSSSRSSDFSRELAREKERQRRERDGSRERRRSRSRERHPDRHHDRRSKDSEKRHKHRSRSRSRSRERRKDREERRERHGHRSHKSRNGDF
ncbi:pre-mRNA-splicing factor 38B-like isoform X2 [Liolophura sinensis]